MQEVHDRVSPGPMTRRVLVFAGFVVGAVAGAVGYWVVGLAGLQSSTGSVAMDVAFFLGVMGFVFGLLAPFALVLYVRSRFEDKVRRDLVTIAAYVVGFLSVIGLGAAGVFFLGDLGITTPIAGLAVLDAVSGFVFGGIAGAEGTDSLLVRL